MWGTQAGCGPHKSTAVEFGPSGHARWTRDLPIKHLDDQPPTVVADSHDVFSDQGGRVTALSVKSGRTRWSRNVGSVYGEWLLSGTLVVNADQVGPHAKIIGLDPKTGTTRWTYRPGHGGFYGDPVPTGPSSLILVRGNGADLEALNTTTGQLSWQHRTKGPSEPAAGHGVVIAGSGIWIEGFDLNSGTRLWRIADGDDGQDVESAIIGRTVAFSSDDSPNSQPIEGHSTHSGALRWRSDLSRGYAVSTVPTGFLVEHQTSDGDKLAVLRATTGRRAWAVTLHQHTIDSTVATGSDLVVIEHRILNHGDVDRAPISLQYRSLKTGALRRSLTLHKGHYVDSGLTAAGHGRVLFTDATHADHVDVVANGRLIWRQELRQFAVTPPIELAQHRVFVQTQTLPCAIAASQRKLRTGIRPTG